MTALTAEAIAAARALLVVDVQPTFCEGGELPVPGGDRIAGLIADYLRSSRARYALTVTSQDWHIDPADHFSDEPDFIDTWPPHGLAGTPNALLHPALLAVLGDDARVSIRKGQHAAAYSAFDGTDVAGRTLAQLLQDADISAVDVCGIAESHCVRATCLDALGLGLDVTLLADLTVPVTPASGAAARREIAAAGGRIGSSPAA